MNRVRGFIFNHSIIWLYAVIFCVCIGILSSNLLEEDQFITVEEVESSTDFDTNESIEKDKSGVHAIGTRKLTLRLRTHQARSILRMITLSEHIILPSDLIRIHNPNTGPPASFAIATYSGTLSGPMAMEAIDAETSSIQT